ncbi:MAG: hypothetical protein ACJ79N_05065 [Gemmatimonadaceae bacterium]
MTLDRRRFLQLSALGIIGNVAGSGCTASDARDGAAVDRLLLLSILGPDRVRDLGARYRAATPSENTADALRSAISRSRGVRIPLIRNESLADQIEDDFEDARTVLVDGWVLSLTEARQAALYSLSPA